MNNPYVKFIYKKNENYWSYRLLTRHPKSVAYIQMDSLFVLLLYVTSQLLYVMVGSLVRLTTLLPGQA